MAVRPRLLAVAVAVGLGLIATLFVAQRQRGAPHSGRLERLWPAPAFSYRDQHGTRVTAEGLRGKVWVANFIFTQCRTICPALTAKMAQLQRRLEGLDVRFVSFSVDPAHDSPEVLAAYAQKWRPHEQRWALLSTDAETLPALARAFKIVAQANEAPDALDPILHSATFLLVDEAGVVRGHYHSDDPRQFAELEEDLVALVRQAPTAALALSTTGPALYRELSCDVCHENAALAPALRGLAGARRPLTHAQSATFDAAYVRESILRPEVKRVDGYPLQMPSYAGLLDGPRLETLTQWLLERPAVADAGATAVTTARDPICGMDVRAGPDAFHTQHEGQTVYFCSARCKDQFEKSASAHSGK